jgi:heme exporter protein D
MIDAALQQFSSPLMYLVVIAWLYVALMMAVAEATSPIGTVTGAFFTFLLYGAGPVALVVYVMDTPRRRKAIRAREAAELARRAAADSNPPDAGGKTPAATVPPVRKES